MRQYPHDPTTQNRSAVHDGAEVSLLEKTFSRRGTRGVIKPWPRSDDAPEGKRQKEKEKEREKQTCIALEEINAEMGSGESVQRSGGCSPLGGEANTGKRREEASQKGTCVTSVYEGTV